MQEMAATCQHFLFVNINAHIYFTEFCVPFCEQYNQTFKIHGNFNVLMTLTDDILLFFVFFSRNPQLISARCLQAPTSYQGGGDTGTGGETEVLFHM